MKTRTRFWMSAAHKVALKRGLILSWLIIFWIQTVIPRGWAQQSSNCDPSAPVEIDPTITRMGYRLPNFLKCSEEEPFAELVRRDENVVRGEMLEAERQLHPWTDQMAQERRNRLQARRQASTICLWYAPEQQSTQAYEWLSEQMTRVFPALPTLGTQPLQLVEDNTVSGLEGAIVDFEAQVSSSVPGAQARASTLNQIREELLEKLKRGPALEVVIYKGAEALGNANLPYFKVNFFKDGRSQVLVEPFSQGEFLATKSNLGALNVNAWLGPLLDLQGEQRPEGYAQIIRTSFVPHSFTSAGVSLLASHLSLMILAKMMKTQWATARYGFMARSFEQMWEQAHPGVEVPQGLRRIFSREQAASLTTEPWRGLFRTVFRGFKEALPQRQSPEIRAQLDSLAHSIENVESSEPGLLDVLGQLKVRVQQRWILGLGPESELGFRGRQGLSALTWFGGTVLGLGILYSMIAAPVGNAVDHMVVESLVREPFDELSGELQEFLRGTLACSRNFLSCPQEQYFTQLVTDLNSLDVALRSAYEQAHGEAPNQRVRTVFERSDHPFANDCRMQAALVRMDHLGTADERMDEFSEISPESLQQSQSDHKSPVYTSYLRLAVRYGFQSQGVFPVKRERWPRLLAALRALNRASGCREIDPTRPHNELVNLCRGQGIGPTDVLAHGINRLENPWARRAVDSERIGFRIRSLGSRVQQQRRLVVPPAVRRSTGETRP